MSADLPQYTDTDATQHWTARRVLASVLEGRSYDERLSAKELAAYVDPGPSAVRDLVADLRRDFGLPVYSRGSGYWCLQDANELRDAIHREADLIETKRETIDSLRDAFHADTTMTRQKPPGVFARETRDTSDEYAEARIKNATDPERLTEIYRVECERDDPRDDRLRWVVETLADIDALRELAALEADAEDVAADRLGRINQRLSEVADE